MKCNLELLTDLLLSLQAIVRSAFNLFVMFSILLVAVMFLMFSILLVAVMFLMLIFCW